MTPTNPLPNEFSAETKAALVEAWRSRGRTYRSGAITDPVACAYIRESDLALDRHRGHRWLKRRAVRGVPRGLDWLFPYPLFFPEMIGLVGAVLFLVGGVKDVPSWNAVPCHPFDPLCQFERPVPIATSLDVMAALSLSGLSYSGLEYYRRYDHFLMNAIDRVGGSSINYLTRPFLAWLDRRGFDGQYEDQQA